MICGQPGCDRELAPESATLDQAQGTIKATVYRCECGWSRTDPVRPTQFVLTPWKTAGVYR